MKVEFKMLNKFLFVYRRGDHTSCSMYVAVLPPKVQCVVFSIDGSFTASVSVTGRDPKVRAGAVDVVRYDFFCIALIIRNYMKQLWILLVS